MSYLRFIHYLGFTVEEVKAEDDLSKWRSHGIKEGEYG